MKKIIFSLIVPLAFLVISCPVLAANNAKFISQNVPSFMTPGSTDTVTITFENTGTNTWLPGSATGYKLGSQNPQDNSTWVSSSRVLLSNLVFVGNQHTFTFVITAPQVPGTYDFQWRMVQEFTEWFGDFTPNVQIVVGNSPPRQACSDTIKYLQTKVTGHSQVMLSTDTTASMNRIGQYFDAPQEVTVSGVDFWGYADVNTDDTVIVYAALYELEPDSLPGAGLGGILKAIGWVHIDSTGRSDINNAKHSVTFTVPYATTKPYMIALQALDSNNALQIYTSSDTANDGAGENLMNHTQGVSWVRSHSTGIDYDVLLCPYVSYTMEAPAFGVPPNGCLGDQQQFLPSTFSPLFTNRMYNTVALSGQPALSFTWNYGEDSTLSKAQIGFYTYNTPGTYTVTLYDSLFGWTSTCAGSGNGDIEINGLNADFDFTVNGSDVQFNDSTLGDPDSWLWTFDDGDSATIEDPRHIYNAIGNYNVCMSVTDVCGTDSICKNVNVGCTGPFAGFSGAVSNDTVFLIDTSVNVVSWVWDFGDGDTSTVQNPIHVYDTAGQYTVCLATDNACWKDTACKTFNVGCDIPVANYTESVVGLDVTFMDVSTGGATIFFWDFGDGNSSTMQNPMHTYLQAGSYEVCFSITNACGTNLVCDTVNVNCQIPDADFTSAADTNKQVMFMDASQNADIWSWTFGDGNSSTVQNPTHTYSDPGSYNACLTISNSCGTSIKCDTIEVTCTAPIADFGTTENGNTLIMSDSSQFVSSWFWEFGDDSTSVMQNPSHTYAEAKAYDVCLTATNGCTSTKTCKNIAVNCTLPVPDFSFTVGGNTGTFTNESTGATSVMWDFGDGTTSNIGDIFHSFKIGEYNVCLTATNGCGSSTHCDSVIIDGCQDPFANFTYTGAGLTYDFKEFASSEDSWSWDFGDGNGSNLPNPSYTYGDTGTYDVCLIVSNHCSSDTLCKQVKVLITGTNDFDEFAEIKVYPNPVRDLVYVDNLMPAQTYNVNLFDLSGRLVREEEIQGYLKFGFGLEELNAGLYILNLDTGTRSRSFKLRVIR